MPSRCLSILYLLIVAYLHKKVTAKQKTVCRYIIQPKGGLSIAWLKSLFTCSDEYLSILIDVTPCLGIRYSLNINNREVIYPKTALIYNYLYTIARKIN